MIVAHPLPVYLSFNPESGSTLYDGVLGRLGKLIREPSDSHLLFYFNALILSRVVVTRSLSQNGRFSFTVTEWYLFMVLRCCYSLANISNKGQYASIICLGDRTVSTGIANFGLVGQTP